MSVFKEAAEYMLDTFDQIEDAGFPLKVLDLGGGLGIEYKKENLAPGLADWALAGQSLPDHLFE